MKHFNKLQEDDIRKMINSIVNTTTLNSQEELNKQSKEIINLKEEIKTLKDFKPITDKKENILIINIIKKDSQEIKTINCNCFICRLFKKI